MKPHDAPKAPIDPIATDAADARLVRAIDQAWRPVPLTSGERAAMRRAIEARTQAATGRRWAWSGLAAAASAALAAVLVFGNTAPVAPPVTELTVAALTDDLAVPWEEELLLSTDLDESEAVRDEAFLPDEYVALADAFLDF